MPMATPVDITGAIDLRRRRANRRRRIVLAVLLVLVLLLGVGLWVVRQSSLLDVRQVEVTGSTLVDPARVGSVSGIRLHTPLSRVDTGAAASKVAALPTVRSVEVSRDWPHTVRITVTERTAVYQLSTRDGFVRVDSSGIAFLRTTTQSSGLPKVLISRPDARLLRDVATVAGSFDAGLRGQIEQVEVTGADSITLVLTKNRRVVWGSADESALKAKVTSAMLKVPAKVYDVSSPEHPTSR